MSDDMLAGQEGVEGEEAEGSELEEDAGAVDESAAKIANLEAEIAALKAGSVADQEPEQFEPNPLFTDEEFEQIDEENKPLYKALNQSHMTNQRLEKRIEDLEAGNAEAGQEKGIENFIESNPQLASNPALAKTFRGEINAALKSNDGMGLLEAIAFKVIGQAKGKPDKRGSTSKPRSVAGSVRKDIAPNKYTNAEQGMEAAKAKILAKGT